VSAQKVKQYYATAVSLTNAFESLVGVDPKGAASLMSEAQKYLKFAEEEKAKLDENQPTLEVDVQQIQNEILNIDDSIKKVLIIGGAGFIGSHLARRMVNDGCSVTIIDNMSTGRKENLEDIKDQIKLLEVTEQNMYHEIGHCDLIVHLAASVGVKYVEKNPLESIMNNLMMENIVFTMNSRFKKPLIFASTSEVYGRSKNVPFEEDDDLLIGNPKELRWGYACSKLMGEFILRAHDFPFVIVRFFNVVGPGQLSDHGMVIPSFVQRAINGEPIEVYGTGSQIRSFCHVNDAVDALMMLAFDKKHYNDTYNIGNEDNQIMMSQLARKVNKEKSKIGGLPSGSVIKHKYADTRNSTDIEVRVPDTTKIRETTGWEPKIKMGQIIEDVMRHEISRRKN
jgi:UDP-glucose 4-epimerase